MGCTSLWYLMLFILFFVWLAVDNEAFNGNTTTGKKGFVDVKKFEKCAMYIGINLWMYALGSLILGCVAMGMRFAKDSCTIKLADGIAGFVALYQFGFAIWGCTACWFNDDLRMAVGFLQIKRMGGLSFGRSGASVTEVDTSCDNNPGNCL